MDIIILEGIRRSGKSYTIEILKRNFKNLTYYKDSSMGFVDHNKVCPDSIAIGRDLAYAQFLKVINKSESDYLLFDRGYWSTYVYGQCWRNKFTKVDMEKHVKKVEEIYGDFLNNIKVVFLEVDAVDIELIESMNREKDQWDKSHNDYREQYSLYSELPLISKVKVFEMKAFQSSSYIVNKFKDILRS